MGMEPAGLQNLLLESSVLDFARRMQIFSGGRF